MIRVRNGDRIRCWQCASLIEGVAAVIDGDFYCSACAVEVLAERLDRLERRIEELELRNGIEVNV